MAKKLSPIAAATPEADPLVQLPPPPLLDEDIASDFPTDPAEQARLVEEALSSGPAPTDPEWSNWVMAQFESYELGDGKPTADALRRMVEKLVGPIVERTQDILTCPSADNGSAAIALSRIVVDYGGEGRPCDFRVFTDVGEVNRENVGETKFLSYAAGFAVTRAESRNCRKILNLHKVYAADELPQSKSLEPPPPPPRPDAIEDVQIEAINLVCRAKKIDVVKLLAKGKKAYVRIEDMTYDDAVKLLGYLHEYRSGKKPIPPDILIAS